MVRSYVRWEIDAMHIITTGKCYVYSGRGRENRELLRVM